jgi:hypothetical protein
MLAHTRTARPARRGSVTALVAVCLTVMITVVAIAVDGGMLLTNRRQAQTVADAAALAAAGDLYKNWAKNQGADPQGAAAASALSVASANGYTNDGITSTVTVNIPPLSGTHAGTKGYVEVIVNYYQPRGFSNVCGSGKLLVYARTVARGLKIPAPPAVLVLNPTIQEALQFDKCTGFLDVTGGTICVDSSHAVADHWNGGSNVAGHVLAEEVDIHGSTNHPDYFVTAPTPNNVITGAQAVADPLSGLAAPDPTALGLTSQSNTSPTGAVTINPGVYNGGLTIAGAGANVVMNSGIYYMKGGNYKQSGGTVTGTGVFIYSEGSGNVMEISGGTCTLSAPTSGTYKDVLFFGSRSATGKPVVWSGSGNSTLNGKIYAPAAEIQFTASGNVTVGDQVISDTMTINGSGTLKVKGSGSSTRDIRLVE